MKHLIFLLFLIPTFAQAQIVDDIISIIQNDTTYQSVAFSYEYELEGGAIKYPDSLIVHLDYQLLEAIPDKWPNQTVFFTEPWTCTQVVLPSGEVLDKHLVTYSPAHGEYILCFFVIEINDDWIEIDYTVRTGRHWW